MLQLVSISYSAISYVTEENSRVVEALRNCLPIKFRGDKVDKTASHSQFGDPLILYSYQTTSIDKIESILQFLAVNLDQKNKQYLTRNLKKKIDIEDRAIYVRFDKFMAYEEKLEITEGGDVIRMVLSYTAYTQEQNQIENVISVMSQLLQLD